MWTAEASVNKIQSKRINLKNSLEVERLKNEVINSNEKKIIAINSSVSSNIDYLNQQITDLQNANNKLVENINSRNKDYQELIADANSTQNELQNTIEELKSKITLQSNNDLINKEANTLKEIQNAFIKKKGITATYIAVSEHILNPQMSEIFNSDDTISASDLTYFAQLGLIQETYKGKILSGNYFGLHEIHDHYKVTELGKKLLNMLKS